MGTATRMSSLEEAVTGFVNRTAAIEDARFHDRFTELGLQTNELRDQYTALQTTAERHSQQVGQIVLLNRALETRFDGLNERIDEIFAMIRELGQKPEAAARAAAQAPHARGRGILPLPPTRNEAPIQDNAREEDRAPAKARGTFQFEFPRMEFLTFNGDSPRKWIRWCEKLFSIYRTPDNQKVETAVAYLERKAYVWFKSWASGRRAVAWDEFAEGLCREFEDFTMGDVIGEFNKLTQRGSLLEYQERFDELRSLMISYNPAFTEDYFISSFISGLEDELRPVVTMFQPLTLSHAYQLAKLEEAANEARRRKMISQPRPYYTSIQPNPSSGFARSVLEENKVKWEQGKGWRGHVSTNTSTAMSNRRGELTKGACYKCEERYFYGHVCEDAKKQSNMLHADDEEKESVIDETAGAAPVEVMMQSLSSSGNGNLFVVKGRVGKKRLLILVGTGSTYTFLNKAKAEELGCALEIDTPLQLKLANGTVLTSRSVCRAFGWKMQGIPFSYATRILQLGAYDMVLGLDWLHTISPVKFDFIKLQMFFEVDGQKVTLTGLQDTGNCRSMTGTLFTLQH